MTDSGDLTVEVCLRSAVAGVTEARQSAVLDRAKQLKRSGVVDNVTVTYWSSSVTAPDDGARNDSGVPDVVLELYDATGDSDRSLSPFFREKPGCGRTVLFLPVVCLVVRRDGDVVGVYPSATDDVHESVQDGLDALSEGEQWANLA